MKILLFGFGLALLTASASAAPAPSCAKMRNTVAAHVGLARACSRLVRTGDADSLVVCEARPAEGDIIDLPRVETEAVHQGQRCLSASDKAVLMRALDVQEAALRHALYGRPAPVLFTEQLSWEK